MASKAFYIILLCFMYNAGHTEPALVSSEIEPVVAENNLTSDLANEQEFLAEDAKDEENINLYIKENGVEDKKSKPCTKKATPKGRKLVTAIAFLLFAAVSAYLYILKNPLDVKRMLKIPGGEKDEPGKPDGKKDVAGKRKLEPPADIMLKVRPLIFETAKENLILEVLIWNTAFDLEYQTAREFDNMVGDRYLEWDENFLNDVVRVVDKTTYDTKFSDEDITNIVKERENILNDKIKLHLGTADPSLVLAATETLYAAIATVEHEMNIQLPELKELLNKIDGTRLVKLDNIDYLAPLRDLKVDDTAKRLHVTQFINDCQTKFLPKLILVNNYVAPYADFIEQWAAKIKQPDEEVLADYNSKMNQV